MKKASLRALLELIDDLATSSEGSWTDRRVALMNEATVREKDSLAEFISWFPLHYDNKKQ